MIFRENTMDELTLKAYAKINLSLNIVGRRSDGYHLIESVMQSVSLYDIVSVKPESRQHGIELRCDIPALQSAENTAVRAATRFLSEAGIKTGLGIRIKKNIPERAGLGGGSADAAAVLRALSGLFPGAISEQRLFEIAGDIGADVPFCLLGGTAFAEGTGEILTPLPPLENLWFVLVKAFDKGSTAEMYARYDRQAKHPAVPGDMKQAVISGDKAQITALAVNIFEPLYPEDTVREVREKFLELGAAATVLSGSGPVMAGIFLSAQAAKSCVGAINSHGWRAYFCRPVKNGCELISETE